MINIPSKLLRVEKIIDSTKKVDEETEEVGSFDYAVAISRWNMKLLGLWPIDTWFSNVKWSVIFTITIFVFIFPMVSFLSSVTDWELIINQVAITIPLVPFIMKFILMKIKIEDYRTILHRMIVDWTDYHYLSKRNRHSMIYYAKKGRQVTVICVIWLMLPFLAYSLQPIINTWLDGLPWNATTRELPVKGFYPFSTQQSPTFEILYATQSIFGCINGLAIITMDCFICTVVFHACGQFDILATTLEQYGNVEHDSTKDARSHTCACLPCIVRRHVHIINYMDVVERSFSGFVLIQLLGVTFILALEGFQIIMFARDNNISGFFTFILYTITFTCSIFVYCYVGECIIEKSENIGRTVYYNLEWNNFPPEYALSIILLIVRSRRSCKITAGRFATMSLSYYKTILMTSVSYISVLKAINK